LRSNHWVSLLWHLHKRQKIEAFCSGKKILRAVNMLRTFFITIKRTVKEFILQLRRRIRRRWVKKGMKIWFFYVNERAYCLGALVIVEKEFYACVKNLSHYPRQANISYIFFGKNFPPVFNVDFLFLLLRKQKNYFHLSERKINS
jgi:hypothetical protein